MDTPSSSSTSSTVTNGAAGNPQKLVERVAQTAHDTVDRVAAAAGPALEKLRTKTTGAQETLQSKADQFGAMQEEWITSARTYVRENPFTALTIGVLAGLVIGRMGRSD
jgi:ElaB/YqjD/DUF883 family membrane-anchored ribosome-binding protein